MIWNHYNPRKDRIAIKLYNKTGANTIISDYLLSLKLKMTISPKKWSYSVLIFYGFIFD